MVRQPIGCVKGERERKESPPLQARRIRKRRARDVGWITIRGDDAFVDERSGGGLLPAAWQLFLDAPIGVSRKPLKHVGLSAAECGLLVGASSQSIYNWEEGKARPSARHLRAVLALRGLGRRAANEIIESRKAA